MDVIENPDLLDVDPGQVVHAYLVQRPALDAWLEYCFVVVADSQDLLEIHKKSLNT